VVQWSRRSSAKILPKHSAYKRNTIYWQTRRALTGAYQPLWSTITILWFARWRHLRRLANFGQLVLRNLERNLHRKLIVYTVVCKECLLCILWTFIK